MNQAAFPFILGQRSGRAAAALEPRHAPRPAAPARETGDPGDALGFDHARYGLVPPAACLWPGHPVREGWERGRRLVGRHTRPPTLAVRRWLGLRLSAWRLGLPFDDHQIAPQVLRSLEVATHCPITGQPLGTDAEVIAVDDARGWVAGNLALVGPQAAALWRTLTWEQAKAGLARAEAGAPEAGFTAGAGAAAGVEARRGMEAVAAAHCSDHPLQTWRRIVALKSLATPLPDREAAAMPLVVLPPNRLRLVNPLQELQAVLTLQLAAPGWGPRSRAITASLPLGLRCDFNLFFNSLLAQALRQCQGAGRAEMRDALALAWEDAIVQRRWARFARLVDAALARTLVDRLAREGLPGLHVVRHEEERLAA